MTVDLAESTLKQGMTQLTAYAPDIDVRRYVCNVIVRQPLQYAGEAIITCNNINTLTILDKLLYKENLSKY